MANQKKDATKRNPQKKIKKKSESRVQRREKGEKADKKENFAVVGIGASAGGVKALEGFFNVMPPNSGLAFVVIQHLDPRHESYMASLLEQHTRMKVVQTTNGMTVEPNRVYLKPPNRDVVIAGHTLQLLPPKEKRGTKLPIDTFFRSLAEELREMSIGIILSGTGADGTMGAKEIKGAGGLVLAQDPYQAEYPDMPRSVIESEAADFTLPVERMPDAFMNYLGHPFVEFKATVKKPEKTKEEKIKDAYPAILALIRRTTGHDFTGYKNNTVHRRIGRRMAIHRVKNPKEYLRFLRENPEEVTALFKDMLINVTNFFRDAPAWEVLARKVIKPMIKDDPLDMPIRAWVPGCGSGEEAFTLAILIHETMEKIGVQHEIKIFATDIDEEAIAIARESVYPENITSDVSPERLRKYFSEQGGKYKVENSVREMVIFAIHDILKDPPFSQLNLISCRNLLIYMGSGLQEKIIPLMHYSLRPDGYLFLGTSESIGDFTDMFSVVNQKYKIFQSHEMESRQAYYNQFEMAFGNARGDKSFDRWDQSDEQKQEKEIQKKLQIRRQMEQTILETVAPPAVFVDKDLNVLYFHGDTRKFLHPPVGEVSYKILSMTDKELANRIKEAVDQIKKGEVSATYNKIIFDHDGAVAAEVDVIPSKVKVDGREVILITFREKKVASKKKRDDETLSAEDSKVRELENQLIQAKQNLHATIEELETSNEELKSANEELQANNEELQSTNEELESSKEELHSTNEELETVNAELRSKNEELQKTEDYLRNLFSHSPFGAIFLDNDLKIIRFTPAVQSVFNLIERDVGRALSDITTNLKDLDIVKESEDVLDTLAKKEVEVGTKDGRWLHVNLMPLRTDGNRIAGVVINFLDITRAKELEKKSEREKLLRQNLIDALPQPAVLIDAGFKIKAINTSFKEAFDLTPKSVQEKKLETIIGWGSPELGKKLEKRLTQKKDIKAMEITIKLPGIGDRTARLSVHRLSGNEVEGEWLLLIDTK